ncbi:hypothetical protein KJ652_00350 [Patescibacteria group bacterium]|nr:hypothetical protein [Patescibacteria group bacterium]MBU1123023.1 hypothetical protein [Patescibacteria group bacterium]
MSDIGGPESFSPDEGVGGVSEVLSEEAKQRFAGAAAAMQQIKKEEKQSKKRDDQVANAIIQFLGSDDHAHLFVLISRLVARDCPSIFILSILSLINDECLKTVQEYLKEIAEKTAEETVDESMALTKTGELDPETNKALVSWITRMQMVLSISPEAILLKLMIDEKNIDGTVLQLTTFVLQEFFEKRKKALPFEKLQPLTAGILQAVLQPFMESVKKALLEQAEEGNGESDD